MLPPPPSPPQLSPKEEQVLRAIVRGRTNDEIARCLGISPRTVQTHVRNLMAKTETRNRTHLAVLALRLRLVGLPPLDALLHPPCIVSRDMV